MPVIALVGGVGVGKTYLGRRWKEMIPSAVFIEEDTAQNLYLNEFYSDMRKWGFHSRISMLAMVLSNMAQAQLQAQQDNIVILDRCVEELIVFATKEYEEGNLTEKEFTLYKQLYYGILDILPRPDVFVYFRCKPETSYQRIMQRGRDCEKGIDISFCADVINRYDAWRDNLKLCKVLNVDTDKELDVASVLQHILSLLNDE